MTSFSNPQFERMYEEAIDAAYEYLIKPVESVPGREHDLLTIWTMNWGSYRHELQHLTCFAGGMYVSYVSRTYDPEQVDL